MPSASTFKTAVAAGSAVLVGAASSLAGVSPAIAATAGPTGVPACTDLASMINGVSDLTTLMDFSQQYVLPCVPQFGLGKIEFTINSDHDLPTGFALEESLATAVTDDFDINEVIDYVGVNAEDASVQSSSAFQGIYRIDDGSDPTSATYQALLILPLESVEVVALGDLPSACTGTYTHAFRISAEERTTTLSGQAGLTAWSIPITVSPTPIEFAVNMSADGTTTNGDSCISILDQTQPITGVTEPLIYKAGTMLLLGLGVFAASGLTGSLPFTLEVSSTPVLTDLTLTESPALPNTGVDSVATTAGTLGAIGFVLLGGYLVTLRRRRSSRRGV